MPEGERGGLHTSGMPDYNGASQVRPDSQGAEAGASKQMGGKWDEPVTPKNQIVLKPK